MRAQQGALMGSNKHNKGKERVKTPSRNAKHHQEDKRLQSISPQERV